jgi:hypothetical protein
MNTIINTNTTVRKAFAILAIFALLLVGTPVFNAEAAVGSIDTECQAAGFDFGIAKYQSAWTLDEGDGTGINVSGTAQSVNWTANPAVAGVVAKTGTDSDSFAGGSSGQINAWVTVPGPSGNKKDISHITFCGNQSQDPETASLTIVKEVEAAGDNVLPTEWSFDFDRDGNDFTLDNELSSLDLSGPIVGEHNFTETSLPTDWYLTGVTCEGLTEEQWSVDSETDVLTVNLEDGDEATCTFTNTYRPDVEAPVCNVGENLLLNGSFEDPVVGGDWGIFGVVANWLISNDGLELWRNFMGGASDGEQNAELDGNSPTTITQTVATTPGATYELRFDFSPRPGTDFADNNVDATADGNVVINASGDGTELAATDWTTYSNTFVATDSSTDIAFADKGTANATGSLIDNAVLCLVSNPETPDDNGGGGGSSTSSGGGGGPRISLRDGEPSGRVAGRSDSTTPVPQVLGDATSIIPAGAPNTGFGGTSSESTTIPTLFTLLAMFVAAGAIRATRKDA